MILFQNMLLADAFTNYRQIMGDVTLSPAMGQYLDMANNAMADPATGAVANENYARELMQLFTIGTSMLNQDGSVQLDSNGLPIPTYSQSTITEFARVYTGWTYAPAPGQPVEWGAYITSNGPMVPYPPEHDSGFEAVAERVTVGPLPRRPHAAAGSEQRARQHLQPSQRRAVCRQAADPAPGQEQSQPGLYLARGGGLQQQRPRRARRHAGGHHRHPARSRSPRQRQRRQRSAHRRPPAGAGAVHRRHGARLRRPDDRPELLRLRIWSTWARISSIRPAYSITIRRTYGRRRAPTLLGREFQIHTPNTAICARQRGPEPVRPVFESGAELRPGHHRRSDAVPSAGVDARDSGQRARSDADARRDARGMKTAIVNAVTADTAGTLHRCKRRCYLILTSSYYNVWH